MTRKVAVVGMGHVGATVAHYLVSGGFVDELVLFDTNEAKVNSDALDLRDAMANLPTHTNLYVNDWDQVADCDVVISALGKSKLVDTPDHDRFAEFKFTRTQVPVVGQKLKDHGFHGNLVVITNPCDVITAMYQKATGLPKHQVLGTGTLLDSARMRRWYENGYISEDVVTSGEDARAYFKAGTAFAALATLKPGYAFKESKTIGKEMEQVGIIAPTTNTTVVQSIQWTIPENCEYPEKAMQMLNLMYSDETVMNLLAWGIEGEHYEVLDSGLIDYPEGVTGETSGYNLNYGWMFGNQFITYVWNGDSPTIWEETDAFNKSAKKSAAFGFSYDSANVKTELAACSNVVSEYNVSLTSGLVDPETAIPEFVEKLEASGIDKIIAEKQSQLDAWAAERGK